MSKGDEKTSFDVVVIGGGPGGYPAAIRASQLGLSVALVESTHLGGICLNWGCIPTKALLHSAEVFQLAHHMKEFGVNAGEPTADMGQMVKRSRQVSKRLTTGIKSLMKKNKVTVFDGFGRLAGPGSVAHRSPPCRRRISFWRRARVHAACPGLKPMAIACGLPKKP
jgi:dihydrolipoamide dehydrogenase